MDDFEREQYLSFLESEKANTESNGSKKPMTSATLLSTILALGIPWEMASILSLSQLWDLMEELDGKRQRTAKSDK